MTLIDTHCHLNYDYSPKSCREVIDEAQKAGIEALVTIGTDLETLPQIQKISEEFETVFHTVGVHPHEAKTLQDSDILRLEQAAQHPKCRGIGEIGLDFHYNHSSKEIQLQQLQNQLDLALRVNKPVIIHSREGETELLEALRGYRKRLADDRIPGVIHCFSGTTEFGLSCIEMGFYISFSGILTFKKADEIRNAARLFPLNKLLVETDSPYLAPMPHRGKKCEPSMVRLTAEKLAEVKGLTLAEVASVTTRNAKKVFQIP